MKRLFLFGLVLLIVWRFALPLRLAAEEVDANKEENASSQGDIDKLIDETMKDVEKFLNETSQKPPPELPINRIEEIKNKSIDLEFTQANLEDVLRVIGKAAEVNIVLDPILKGKKVDLYLKSTNIHEALELICSAYGLSSYPIGNILFFSTKEKIKEAAMQTKVFELKNINVEEAKSLIDKLVKVINTSKETNSLVVMGSPEEIKKVEDILNTVDISQSQVLLEAKIIEINTDVVRDIGIDWSDEVKAGFQEGKREFTLTDPATVVGSPFRIYRLARSALQFDATLKMLEEKGDAKVLSNPRVTTMNNKEAEIFIGDKVPYTITTVSGGVATTEVRFAEAGIRLKITPSIIEEDFTVIKIEPEVSYIYRWRGPEDQYPWVKTRQATAYVRIKNKQPFVLGGLLGKEDKKNLYKVPLLGDIPLLGNLFKYNKTSVANSELIITITPTIISQ